MGVMPLSGDGATRQLNAPWRHLWRFPIGGGTHLSGTDISDVMTPAGSGDRPNILLIGGAQRSMMRTEPR